jgi:hypothetical protein
MESYLNLRSAVDVDGGAKRQRQEENKQGSIYQQDVPPVCAHTTLPRLQFICSRSFHDAGATLLF